MQPYCSRHLAAVLLVALLSGSATIHLWAQATGAIAQDANANVSAYEVVSIKLASPGERNSEWKDLPNGFDYTNRPLFWLIYSAYGIRMDSQISGLPEWADRCQLKMRREVKELPVYDLVIARGGLKMKEAAPDEAELSYLKTYAMYSDAGQSEGVTMTMTTHAGTALALAQNLPRYAGRIIVDKTGLGDKRFDFELKWSSDPDAPADKGGTGPAIFKALEEQLGLKLEPAKEPVDTFVVEQMERPTAN